MSPNMTLPISGCPKIITFERKPSVYMLQKHPEPHLNTKVTKLNFNYIQKKEGAAFLST